MKIDPTLRENITRFFLSFSSERYAQLLTDFCFFLCLCVIATAIYFITWKIIARVFKALVEKTSNTYDDELVRGKFVRWVSNLSPALVIWNWSPQFIVNETFQRVIQTTAELYLIIMITLVVFSLLNAAHRIYDKFSFAKKIPILGFVQGLKILISIAAGIFIISILLGKSPALIFSGLGALTAIMMLIFKDSILGLAAGIQLSSNQMIAEGDWIEMPKFGADGTVLEVALTTVKVQNWDKTITTIPTYALITDSFKNWQGMSDSGLRRIKRHLSLDLNTVGFLSEEKIEELKKLPLIVDYLTKKQSEVTAWNKERDLGPNEVSSRSLTNIGTFRIYVKEYLSNHPKISQESTLLIRQLQPTAQGIPLEIYVFATDNRWVYFEEIQSDIFDHLLSIAPVFDLGIFQNPTGADFSRFSHFSKLDQADS